MTISLNRGFLFLSGKREVVQMMETSKPMILPDLWKRKQGISLDVCVHV